MKKSGKHPEKALSSAFVRNVTEAGRYADGNGLYLLVKPSGSKQWIARITIHGKRRDMGLGAFSTTSLSDAREEILAIQKAAKRGDDPIAIRRQLKRKMPTFSEAIRSFHEQQKNNWGNNKHSNQWIKSLIDHIEPHLGQLRIDSISTSNLMDALIPIWTTKAETAKRIVQRLRLVFDWAKAKGFRSDDNPVNALKFGLTRQNAKQAHHKALPYDKTSLFYRELAQFDAPLNVLLAFRFLILTASRSGEVIGAEWSDIDFHNRLWIVPPGKMKSGREHRVPLTSIHLEILDALKENYSKSTYVFGNTKSNKPLHKNVFFKTIKKMNYDITTHGFRSSFRDWAAESDLNFSNEVCEMSLAHTVRNKTEAAYRRSDLLDKRRELMNEWCLYVCGEN